MRYPNFLNANNTIGLVAPSFGACGSPYGLRYEKAMEKFNARGYFFKTVEHVNVLENGESASATTRASEFMKMYADSDVDFIISVAGGEKELQILPYIDFEELQHMPPKYFMGYSDNTTLSFTLTTLCDIASIYANHITDFGVTEWDKCLMNTYECMKGRKLRFSAYPKIQLNDLKHEQPFFGYNLEFDNKWKNFGNMEHLEINGRLLGGCLDVLVGMCGTKYDKVKQFSEKYAQEGILWYLEACDLNPFGTMRALWQLREAGWFEHAKGFLIGRPNNPDDVFEYSHLKAIEEVLAPLRLPIIFDFDTGHVPPMIPLINGSMAHVVNNSKESYIEMELR